MRMGKVREENYLYLVLNDSDFSPVQRNSFRILQILLNLSYL